MRAWHILSLLVLSLFAAVASAQVTVTGYTETGNLPRNDDDHSSAVALGFSINFGGTTFTETYVSNNGYLTFGEGSGSFTPNAFDASYSGLPVIAAFYSDIDTRNAATGIVSWGTATVDNRAAFVAKWDRVGEYSNGDSPNSFEIILVDRSDRGTGSFDVHFVYGTITWDHGGAVAGYYIGGQNPQYYQLPGSLVAGAFLDGASDSLAARTNAGAAGGYLLQSVNGAFLTAGAVVPEPSTWALLASGAGLLAVGAWRRRRTSH